MLSSGAKLCVAGYTAFQPLDRAAARSAGFLLGSRQTLLETFDGGKTWEPRTVAAARVRTCLAAAHGARRRA